MKDEYTTNSHYLTNKFLFKKVGRMYFWKSSGFSSVVNLVPRATPDANAIKRFDTVERI